MNVTHCEEVYLSLGILKKEGKKVKGESGTNLVDQEAKRTEKGESDTKEKKKSTEGSGSKSPNENIVGEISTKDSVVIDPSKPPTSIS